MGLQRWANHPLEVLTIQRNTVSLKNSGRILSFWRTSPTLWWQQGVVKEEEYQFFVFTLTKCEGYFFFQDPIDREIRTTVRIRWSSVQMCCAMSLVCLSIATHRTCQFWARSEHVNVHKTIQSPAKCGVCAVIRFLYSEQATRNVVLRYCPSSWQCSAEHSSCNKEAPEAFSMGSVWSPTIIRPDLAPCDFNLFPRTKRS